MQDTPRRRHWERALVQYIAQGWVAAWSGVIKYHGPRPMPRPGCIWVANHSSMIDYTILTAYMPFAAIMQLQPGWVGFLQKHVLTCLGCLWFHRTEVCYSPHPPLCTFHNRCGQASEPEHSDVARLSPGGFCQCVFTQACSGCLHLSVAHMRLPGPPSAGHLVCVWRHLARRRARAVRGCWWCSR